MQTVILGYLKSFQTAMDDADHNMRSKTRICCWVRFETSFEHVRLLSRDLQTSPQIVHMHKRCIDDDNKVLQTVA